MDSSEIKSVIQTYFDASYENNEEKMMDALSDSAHVYGHDENGALRDWDKKTFIKIVGDKSRSGYPRLNEILGIDFTGENTAVARVKLRVGDTIFTDVLSFIRIDGKWSIISKLLSGVPVD